MEYRRLYEDIIQQVLNNLEGKKLCIGDKLPPERELAETIGVSRSTLREAFRVLEQQGIIETKPGDGRYIIGLPKKRGEQILLNDIEKIEIEDLLEARETLETRIVELACERATPEDLVSICEAEMLLINESKDRNWVPVDADYAFHLAVAEASHNVVFINYIRINLELLARIRERTLNSPKRRDQFINEHRAIREAIEARDREAAKLAQQIHLRNIRRRMKMLICI
jgi:GntR family transcriptional repressor for pyruvate dehydrogenase complex